MNTVEQKTEFPYYAFDIDFLQPAEKAPHQYATFAYQKPVTLYNHIIKEYYEVAQTQYAQKDLDEYYQVLNNVFTTKTEYLAWKSEWQKGYAELSQMIRHAKNNRKLNYLDKTYKQYQWQQRTELGGKLAKKMMMLLTAAKDMSWEMKTKRLFAEAEVIEL